MPRGWRPQPAQTCGGLAGSKESPGTAAVQFRVLLNVRGLKAGTLLFTDAALVVREAE